MKRTRIARAIAPLFGVLLLQGCVGAALVAAVAPGIAGLMPGKGDVTVDESTVTPELRSSLANAKRLIFFSAESSDTYTSAYLEQHAGYLVTLEAPPAAASPSQARSLMEGLCERAKDTGESTLVISSSSGESSAGMGTALLGAVTGRVKVNVQGGINVHNCQDASWSQFSITIAVSQGIYNTDQSAIEQYLAVGFAQAIMTAAGKPIPEEG